VAYGTSSGNHHKINQDFSDYQNHYTLQCNQFSLTWALEISIPAPFGETRITQYV